MPALLWSIRSARPSDLPLLGPLELRAAQRFRQSAHAYACDLPPFEPQALEQAQQAGRVWVAVDERDAPVGFVIAGHLSEQAYVHELDVEPSFGGLGMGRALVRRVAAWARADGRDDLLLSTFSDVPWNAPFYARIGFEVVPVSEYTNRMRALRENEAAQGMAPESRVIMRAALSRLLGPA